MVAANGLPPWADLGATSPEMHVAAKTSLNINFVQALQGKGIGKC